MKTNIKNVVFSAVFVAIGIVLPQLFHIFGGIGAVFLPMHIGVLLGGMLLGSRYGAIIGAITPIISHIVTGGAMPPVTPMPILYFMVCELAGYGFFAGLLREKFKLNPYVVLLGAMLLGRIVLLLSVFVFVNLFYQHLDITPIQYTVTAIVTGIPGIAIQIGFIPIIYRLSEKYFIYRNQ